MMLTSPLSKKDYLSALKSQMGSFWAFGTERFTGLILGNFFSISHHCDSEWNRRITGQTNSAIGFVKKTNEGCEVRFLRFKGLLHPPRFVLFMGFMLLFALLISLGRKPIPLPVTLVVAAIIAAIGTLFEAMTVESAQGGKILNALLIDPSDPFSYLHHKNEI